jgi:simple sugar transport system ATP-binding protein
LGIAEQKKVLDLVKSLKTQGIGIIIISHQMYDVFEVADRIIVMRRGQNVATRLVSETTPDEIVGLIVGSETVKR